MSQYLESYKKNIAIEMRKKGLSYSEIKDQIHIPVSTLSFWLRKIKLSDEQKKKLDDRRSTAIKRGQAKNILKRKNEIDELKKHAVKSIHKISDKELWLMGIMLYWRERLLSSNENDLKKGVKFTSSDPYLIKFFLKWLRDVGHIENEELEFDLFLKQKEKKETEEAVVYWKDVVDIHGSNIKNIYYIKKSPGRKNSKKPSRKFKNNSQYGLLRIRVKSSSLLARQIAGWVRGVIKYYWH